jgi:DNA repair exonuclease SbcCD ATPase subunit
MSDIAELEGRITAALDRIRAGVARLGVAAPGGGDQVAAAPDSDLAAQLAEEKTVTAQLEERVRALKARQDGEMATLKASEEKAAARLAAVERDLQKLRQANAELRSINSKLREALSANVSEPHLINKAMLAELEALRAVRAADAAEVDLVLEALAPIMEGSR